MKRGLWFVAGAGTAVYVMVRGRRAAEVFTVDGLKDRLGAPRRRRSSATRSRRARPTRNRSCASGSASCLMELQN